MSRSEAADVSVEEARDSVLEWLGVAGAPVFSDQALVHAALVRAGRDLNLKLVTHWSSTALAFQARWEEPNGRASDKLPIPFEHEHLEAARLLACAAAASKLAR